MEDPPDAVLLDLHMPHMNGFQVLEKIRECIENRLEVPVLMLTGDGQSSQEEKALEAGANDFIIKPIRPERLLPRLNTLLELSAVYKDLQRQKEGLEQRVLERTKDLKSAQDESLRLLACAAEYRDDATGRHAIRVGELSALVAKELGLPAASVETLRITAPLHDVGKIGIPDGVLLKPSALTESETDTIRGHTRIGGDLLSGWTSDLLQAAAQIARSHHERWDGTGYPDGLTGEKIPLFARIVSVVDAFDAIVDDRPYSVARPVSVALARLRKAAGSQFDPKVVDAFERIVGTDPVEAILAGMTEATSVRAAGLINT